MFLRYRCRSGTSIHPGDVHEYHSQGGRDCKASSRKEGEGQKKSWKRF